MTHKGTIPLETDRLILRRFVLYTHYVDKDDLMEQHKTLFTDNRQVFFLAFCNSKPFAVAHGALRSEYINGNLNSHIFIPV